MNVGDRLMATNGRPTGFDYLRLGLAVAVVLVHSRALTYGSVPHPHLGMGGEFKIPWMMHAIRPISVPIVPMFFALSGFLVAGSLERSKTLLTFLGLRVIRIYPALFVEVVLSALLIGTAVTTLPLVAYFRDPMFFSYMLNVLGNVHFSLPGVFENNPTPGIVNGQLWTVPFELLCYVTLAGLMMAGAIRHRILVPLGAVGLALFFLMMRLLGPHWQLPTADDRPDGNLAGYIQILCFLVGVSFYLYKDRIAWSCSIFFGALAAMIILLLFIPFGEYPAILAIAYVTIYLGLTNFTRFSVIRGADYSYGIYLYGFAVLQLFVFLVAPEPRFWWVTALVGVILSGLVAAFSWNFVEKPAQKLRKFLPTVEREYITLRDRLSGWLRASLRALNARVFGVRLDADATVLYMQDATVQPSSSPAASAFAGEMCGSAGLVKGRGVLRDRDQLVRQTNSGVASKRPRAPALWRARSFLNVIAGRSKKCHSTETEKRSPQFSITRSWIPKSLMTGVRRSRRANSRAALRCDRRGDPLPKV